MFESKTSKEAMSQPSPPPVEELWELENEKRTDDRYRVLNSRRKKYVSPSILRQRNTRKLLSAQQMGKELANRKREWRKNNDPPPPPVQKQGPQTRVRADAISGNMSSDLLTPLKEDEIEGGGFFGHKKSNRLRQWWSTWQTNRRTKGRDRR